ncbi:MAG: hypothetical protein ABSC94_10655 [Polyangiaceae bacterium]
MAYGGGGVAAFDVTVPLPKDMTTSVEAAATEAPVSTRETAADHS